jgi:hypothetical protein
MPVDQEVIKKFGEKTGNILILHKTSTVLKEGWVAFKKLKSQYPSMSAFTIKGYRMLDSQVQVIEEEDVEAFTKQIRVAWVEDMEGMDKRLFHILMKNGVVLISSYQDFNSSRAWRNPQLFPSFKTVDQLFYYSLRYIMNDALYSWWAAQNSNLADIFVKFMK